MTEPTDEQLAQICADLAERFLALIAEKLDIRLDYDADSVIWLNDYLERNRHVLEKMKSAENSFNLYGAFLGECLRRNYQGTWTVKDGNWGVMIGTGVAFPFTKVSKQIHGDASDSIASFYRIVGEIASGKLKLSGDNERKPDQ
jgi:hypothetical protein